MMSNSERMNKKLAHTILVFGDLLSFAGLWIGYHIFSKVLIKIANQADMINYGNRVGLFIVGLGFPLLHSLAIIGHYLPDYIHKYKRFINHAVIVMVILLLTAGFSGSYWLRSQVENAGYLYCREASGISALAKTLVYTKDMEICEELAAAKYKHQR